MKHTFLLSLTVLICAATIIPTRAQQAAAIDTMPSPAGLKAPASAAPAAESAVKTNSTVPANTMTGMPDDPCPNLKGAQANAPDDMSKVQEDIDRFTLCVQRAQLLERLNENAEKSLQATDTALGLGGAGKSDVLSPPAGGAMPPLPANALGEAVPRTAAPAATPATAQAPTVAAPAPAATAGWTIKEIYGPATAMEARLISPEGDEVKVKTGMKLSDGSIVSDITPSGVSIRGKSGVKSLDWAKS